jgi:hypothetical protein
MPTQGWWCSPGCNSVMCKVYTLSMDKRTELSNGTHRCSITSLEKGSLPPRDQLVSISTPFKAKSVWLAFGLLSPAKLHGLSICSNGWTIAGKLRRFVQMHMDVSDAELLRRWSAYQVANGPRTYPAYTPPAAAQPKEARCSMSALGYADPDGKLCHQIHAHAIKKGILGQRTVYFPVQDRSLRSELGGWCVGVPKMQATLLGNSGQK